MKAWPLILIIYALVFLIYGLINRNYVLIWGAKKSQHYIIVNSKYKMYQMIMMLMNFTLMIVGAMVIDILKLNEILIGNFAICSGVICDSFVYYSVKNGNLRKVL